MGHYFLDILYICVDLQLKFIRDLLELLHPAGRQQRQLDVHARSAVPTNI